MFSGEESVRIRSNRPREELEDTVADVLDRLGAVRFGRGSEFRIRSGRFESALATTRIEGELRKARRDGEWILKLAYQVNPSGLCWAIAIIGYFLVLFGPLILLAPNSTKDEVKRAIRSAIRDARDDIEGA